MLSPKGPLVNPEFLTLVSPAGYREACIQRGFPRTLLQVLRSESLAFFSGCFSKGKKKGSGRYRQEKEKAGQVRPASPSLFRALVSGGFC